MSRPEGRFGTLGSGGAGLDCFFFSCYRTIDEDANHQRQSEKFHIHIQLTCLGAILLQTHTLM